MTRREISENLCVYDKRNPDNQVWALIDMDYTDKEIAEMKKDCYCDNCFYGRTKLANELLKYIN
jgi:hypothetical protein